MLFLLVDLAEDSPPKAESPENRVKRICKLACKGASEDCSASVLRKQNNTQGATEDFGQLARRMGEPDTRVVK